MSIWSFMLMLVAGALGEVFGTFLSRWLKLLLRRIRQECKGCPKCKAEERGDYDGLSARDSNGWRSSWRTRPCPSLECIGRQRLMFNLCCDLSKWECEVCNRIDNDTNTKR